LITLKIFGATFGIGGDISPPGYAPVYSIDVSLATNGRLDFRPTGWLAHTELCGVRFFVGTTVNADCRFGYFKM